MHSDNRHRYDGLELLLQQPPAAGSRIEVIPGLDWIQLPLPFVLNHVNCWWLTGDNGNCLIDTGIDNDAVRQALQGALGAGVQPEKLLITHFHPDHSGLAGWFADAGSHVIGSEIEVAIQRKLYAASDEAASSSTADWYLCHGIARSHIDVVLKNGNTFRPRTTEPPTDWQFVQHGDTVNLGNVDYQVMTGRGHAPDMLMLYRDDTPLLIAADQVLPGISPNVSLMPGQADTDPLASFLESITALLDLPKQTLVLPSHGLPFTGLHQRIAQLQDHHAERCEAILGMISKPQTAAALFPLLFKRKLDAQQLSFALGEVLAHLKYLQNQSQVLCFEENGVQYFSCS